MVPPTKGFSLTTSSLEEYLPGLVAVYGENMPMAILVASHSTPKAIFNVDEMGLDFGIDLRFIVEGQGTAVVLGFDDIEAMLGLTFSNYTLYPKVESVKLNTLQATESTIGELDTRSMKTLINTGLKLAIPVINAFLSSGFKFPSELFGGKIEIESATFNVMQDYLRIEFSPQFHFTQ